MPTLRLARFLSALRIFHFPARLAGRISLARSRRHLGCLDDHLLRDIGVSRHDAEAEASRGAWDAPSHWRG